MPANATEGDNQIRPWASDERLRNPLLLVTISQVISSIQDLATLTEQLPEGQKMFKSESIPNMWETVQDLKPESINKLKTSLKHMQELSKDTSKDNLGGAGSKRDKEASGTEEIDSTGTKAQKSDASFENIMRFQAFNEEGLSSMKKVHMPFHLAVQMYCARLLRFSCGLVAHALCPCAIQISAYVPALSPAQMYCNVATPLFANWLHSSLFLLHPNLLFAMRNCN